MTVTPISISGLIHFCDSSFQYVHHQSNKVKAKKKRVNHGIAKKSGPKVHEWASSFILNERVFGYPVKSIRKHSTMVGNTPWKPSKGTLIGESLRGDPLVHVSL